VGRTGSISDLPRTDLRNNGKGNGKYERRMGREAGSHMVGGRSVDSPRSGPPLWDAPPVDRCGGR
jgi:hypothetical protein